MTQKLKPLIESFDSDRAEIIAAIRENLRYVHENGGEEYCLKIIADKAKECTSLRWDKSYMARFLNKEKGDKDYVSLAALKPDELAKLAKLSKLLRAEIEPHINAALEALSLHLTNMATIKSDGPE